QAAARSPSRSHRFQARHAARDAADPAGAPIHPRRQGRPPSRGRRRAPARRRTLCGVAAATSARRLPVLHCRLSGRQHGRSGHRPFGLSQQPTRRVRWGKTVTIFIIQILNSLFYASVLFLIAAGLSLIYGVMRIVNLAHGTVYALGAYVSAWAVGGAFGATIGSNLGLAGQLLLLPIGAFAIAAVGAVIEPQLLRPLYRRPEEYVLLITFGLLMILEDAMKMLFGGTPLSAGTIMDHMGSFPIGRLLYPVYNLVVVPVGLIAATGLWWFIYRTRFGVILRATSQDRRMAAALGLNVGRV